MSLEALNTETIVILALFLALGGMVKGIIGLGLPMVTVPLISLYLPVDATLSLVAVAIVLTNAYQMLAGGGAVKVFIRFRTLILPLALTTALTTRLLVTAEPAVMMLVLGTLTAGFSMISLANFRFNIPAARERRLSPLFGFLSGICGGFSGFFGPPLLIYFIALELDRDAFVQTIGMVFFVGATSLVIGLAANGIYTEGAWLPGLLSLIPVITGQVIGHAVRRFIPQEAFRKVVLVTVVVIGFNLIRRALFL